MLSTSHQHVRIADVSLDLPSGGLDGVKIKSALSKRSVVVSIEDLLMRSVLTQVVFRRLLQHSPRILCSLLILLMDLVIPLMSACLFLLLMSFSVRESLILTVKYRMLREGETNTVHLFLHSLFSDIFFKRWNL